VVELATSWQADGSWPHVTSRNKPQALDAFVDAALTAFAG